MTEKTKIYKTTVFKTLDLSKQRTASTEKWETNVESTMIVQVHYLERVSKLGCEGKPRQSLTVSLS